jgi:hypothetical protein
MARDVTSGPNGLEARRLPQISKASGPKCVNGVSDKDADAKSYEKCCNCFKHGQSLRKNFGNTNAIALEEPRLDAQSKVIRRQHQILMSLVILGNKICHRAQAISQNPPPIEISRGGKRSLDGLLFRDAMAI